VDYAGFGQDGRGVYLTFCDRLVDVARIQPPETPFVLFLGADSADEPVELLFSIAEAMLASGAVYVLCWGAGAARLEDVFDEAFVGDATGEDLPAVMTTSHEGQPLDEALDFATTVAIPAEEYASRCKTTVIVLAGNVHWYNEAHNILEDLLTREPA
jgi:hypothetical protein